MTGIASLSPGDTGLVELGPAELRAVCDPDRLPFKDTGEVEPLAEPPGQPRALEALDFGIAMTSPGYNIFVTGPSGTGRHDIVEETLRKAARKRGTPGDLVYLFDFGAPDRPNAVLLPPGRGNELRREMSAFLGEARSRITDAFESESYQKRRRTLAQELDRRGEEALAPVRELGAERSLAVELTPAGIAIIPMTHGHPIEPQQFQRLNDDARREIATHTEEAARRRPGGRRSGLRPALGPQIHAQDARDDGRAQQAARQPVRPLTHPPVDMASGPAACHPAPPQGARPWTISCC